MYDLVWDNIVLFIVLFYMPILDASILKLLYEIKMLIFLNYGMLVDNFLVIVYKSFEICDSVPIVIYFSFITHNKKKIIHSQEKIF